LARIAAQEAAELLAFQESIKSLSNAEPKPESDEVIKSTKKSKRKLKSEEDTPALL
jgi:hypothetical protein